MATVFHKYVRKGETIPEPSPGEKGREKSDAKFSEARARKESALADLREGESRRRAGELIERRIAVHQAAFLFVTCRQRMLSLATSLPRKLEGKTQHEMKLIIGAEVRECLTELSTLPLHITKKQLDYFNEASENGKRQPVERKAQRRSRPGPAA